MCELTKTSSDPEEWCESLCKYHEFVVIEKRQDGNYIASVYLQPGKPHRVGAFYSREGNGWYVVDSEILATEAAINAD